MSRIAIDARMAHCSGIGRYIRGTLNALSKTPSKPILTLLGNKSLERDLPGFDVLEAKSSIYGLSEQFEIPSIAKHCDILHTPHYNAPAFWHKKLVVTIHDLIHLHFSSHLNSPFAKFYARTFLPIITEKADKIIAVSEHTKKDLIETLNVAAEKIEVIYHGIDPSFQHQDLQRNAGVKPENIHESYFLYVGLLKPHKNVGILLDAFQKIKKEQLASQLKLRLIGTPDLKHGIVRRWLDAIEANADIIFENNVSDEKLKMYYQNATALILPSFLEGFGFPLIEAMAAGCPLIVANSASLPEIAGEAALYFDPNSEIELMNCMNILLKHEDKRQDLIKLGQKRLSLFNWSTAAKKTSKIYESLLGSN